MSRHFDAVYGLKWYAKHFPAYDVEIKAEPLISTTLKTLFDHGFLLYVNHSVPNFLMQSTPKIRFVDVLNSNSLGIHVGKSRLLTEQAVADIFHREQFKLKKKNFPNFYLTSTVMPYIEEEDFVLDYVEKNEADVMEKLNARRYQRIKDYFTISEKKEVSEAEIIDFVEYLKAKSESWSESEFDVDEAMREFG